MIEPELITDDLFLSVVTGTAAPDESDRVFAAAMNDPALRMRLALALPPDSEDADVADAVDGPDGATTGTDE